MKTFNDVQQGDIVTFEMRVREASRQIMQQMFVSAEENKALLQGALESAMNSVDLKGMMEKQAKEAIGEAIHVYFSYGEGHKVISEAVNTALGQTIPGLFKKKS